MRNKKKIQQLEIVIADISEQLAMLIEMVTRPELTTQPEEINFRNKPRKAVKTTNRMKSWTEEDMKLANEMRSKGATISQIANILGRSNRGVTSMFARYGFTHE